MEEVHKNKLTQWGSHILMSILMSHMMVTKNPQNVHIKYFWPIVMTFIFDVKIYINICEPYYINWFLLWTFSIVQVFDFLKFDIFLITQHLVDNLTLLPTQGRYPPGQGRNPQPWQLPLAEVGTSPS